MNPIVNFTDFLETVPAFAEFDAAELVVLGQAMVVDYYPDEYVFIGEEQRGENMFVVVEGEVVATHKRLKMRGIEVMERLGPGDLFGLVELIDHHYAWATYRAVGAVTVASLPAAAFELLFTAHTPIAHHFQGLIALQLARDLRVCIQDLVASFAKETAVEG